MLDRRSRTKHNLRQKFGVGDVTYPGVSYLCHGRIALYTRQALGADTPTISRLQTLLQQHPTPCHQSGKNREYHQCGLTQHRYTVHATYIGAGNQIVARAIETGKTRYELAQDPALLRRQHTHTNMTEFNQRRLRWTAANLHNETKKQKVTQKYESY